MGPLLPGISASLLSPRVSGSCSIVRPEQKWTAVAVARLEHRDWNGRTGTLEQAGGKYLDILAGAETRCESWLDGVESPLLLQSQHCDDAGLAGVERLAGEPEVLGAPVKVETSALVVAGSSNHKKKQEHVSETSHLGWNYLPAGPLGIAMT